MIYWSKRSDSIVHSYCGSLFVGHCTAVDLVGHYEEFVKQLDIDSKFLLNFGMIRLNFNLSFEDKLTQKLSEVDTSLPRARIMFTRSSLLCISEGGEAAFSGTGSITDIKQ